MFRDVCEPVLVDFQPFESYVWTFLYVFWKQKQCLLYKTKLKTGLTSTKQPVQDYVNLSFMFRDVSDHILMDFQPFESYVLTVFVPVLEMTTVFIVQKDVENWTNKYNATSPSVCELFLYA